MIRVEQGEAINDSDSSSTTTELIKEINDISKRPDQFIFIIDWDDTCLCSSWIKYMDYDLHTDPATMSLAFLSALESLALSVKDMINMASSIGDVYIVTNGDQDWIEMSAEKFMPSLNLKSLNIKEIISAKTKYEIAYPNEPFLWKEKAFTYILNNHFEDTSRISRYFLLDELEEESILFKDTTKTHLISLGDGLFERKAAQTMNQLFPDLVVKTIKFIDNPTMEELKRELIFIWHHLKQLCSFEHGFDVNMKIS